MAHPQNSYRGLFSKKAIRLTASGSFWFEDYSSNTAMLTGDSSGLILAGGVKISNAQLLTGLSTGLVFGNPDGGLPANVTNGVLFGMGSNSTGEFAFVNINGTTHKYLNVTTKQPT